MANIYNGENLEKIHGGEGGMNRIRGCSRFTPEGHNLEISQL